MDERMPAKWPTLRYYSGMSAQTLEKMREFRAKFIALAKDVEELGQSRELSLAFTAIEQAQMYTIKHLCVADPSATQNE